MLKDLSEQPKIFLALCATCEILFNVKLFVQITQFEKLDMLWTNILVSKKGKQIVFASDKF